jgi:hypothetical protein
MSDPTRPASPDQRPTRPDFRAVGRYRVRIFYTEPTYAQQRGIEAAEYTVSYVVGADEAASAEATAREWFRADVEREGVGWVREVVRVEVVLERSNAGGGGDGARGRR